PGAQRPLQLRGAGHDRHRREPRGDGREPAHGPAGGDRARDRLPALAGVGSGHRRGRTRGRMTALLALLLAAAVAAPATPAARPGEPDRAQVLAMLGRGHYPGRSGQIVIVPRKGQVITRTGLPFNHGSPWAYDTRIPVVL